MKTSESMNRCSRSHDIGACGLAVPRQQAAKRLRRTTRIERRRNWLEKTESQVRSPPRGAQDCRSFGWTRIEQGARSRGSKGATTGDQQAASAEGFICFRHESMAAGPGGCSWLAGQHRRCRDSSRGHPDEEQGPAIRGGGRLVGDGAGFGLGTTSRVPDLSSGARRWGTTLYLA